MERKNLFLMFLLMLTGALCLTSCDKDDEEYYAKFLFTFEANLFSDEDAPLLSNGEMLNVSVRLDTDNSSDGVRIKSVEYYFDGEKILTTSTSPYSLKYLIQNQALGSHVLTGKITYKGGDFEFNYDFSREIVVQDAPAYINAPLLIGEDKEYDEVEDSVVVVSRDDSFYGSVPQVSSNIGASITKVEYYWDDVLFGASNVSPYKFSYDISSEETGEHTFIYIVHVTSDYGEFNYRVRKKIIIQ